MLWVGNMSLPVPGSLGWAAFYSPLVRASERWPRAERPLRMKPMLAMHSGLNCAWCYLTDDIQLRSTWTQTWTGTCVACVKSFCPNKSAWMYHTNTTDVHWLWVLRQRTDLKRYSSGGPVQDQGSGIFVGCSWLRTHVQGHPPDPGRSRVLPICRQGPDPHSMNFSGQLPPSAMAHTVRQHKPFLPWLLLSGIWSQRKVTTAEGKA